MTTIVYHRGELATDSKIGRHQSSRVEQFTYGEKVFTSPCGRCYLTKAGDMYNEEFLTRMAKCLLDLVILHINGHMVDRAELLLVITDDWLMVTKDMAYFFESSGKMFEVTGDDWAAMGSGERYAAAAIVAGKTVREAVKLTIERDPLSGGEIQHYRASKLKPLIRKARYHTSGSHGV